MASGISSTGIAARYAVISAAFAARSFACVSAAVAASTVATSTGRVRWQRLHFFSTDRLRLNCNSLLVVHGDFTPTHTPVGALGRTTVPRTDVRLGEDTLTDPLRHFTYVVFQDGDVFRRPFTLGSDVLRTTLVWDQLVDSDVRRSLHGGVQS